MARRNRTTPSVGVGQPSVTFYAGVAVPDAMVAHVERQKAACRQHGCSPNVRVTKGNIYFAHDDWCPIVGGRGQ